MTVIARPRPAPRQDVQKILLHASRYRRAADALVKWSEKAKKAVDYYEGRQWTAADLAKLAAEKRPALNLNKIRPLVNLVLGYHINNRTDVAYMPALDGNGSAEIAATLTHVAKQIGEVNQLPYVDTEVFLDGLLTGRGYWDVRLDFRKNLLGSVSVRALDPFSVYPDPDCEAYDLNEGAFVIKSRWISVEEALFFYGPEVAGLLGPFLRAGGITTGLPMASYDIHGEVSPIRSFDMVEDRDMWNDYFYDFVDGSRKSLRLLEIEHYVLTRRWYFVDLETGDKRAIPDDWDSEKVRRTLDWAQKDMGQPLVVQEFATRRPRITHMIGDVMAYDAWSQYDTFTTVPFFPYHRRGVTQGMVEHLTDAQDEHNKRRSARLNIIGRNSAGGWMFPAGSLDPQQKRNLERFGSTPGITVEYQQFTNGGAGNALNKPEQIQIATTPVAMAQLEKDAEDDLLKIAGINQAAMGQIEAANASGKAVERRQRQAVIGQEQFMSNFRRSKELYGRKTLEVVQGHYTEERIIRTTGEGNNMVQMVINQRTAAGIINDVAVGTYMVAVNETPLSKSFLEQQFEELMEMKGIGMPVPDDFIIDASSIARKTELKLAILQERQKQALAAAQGGEPGGAPAPEGQGAPGPGPGGSRVGKDGGSLPAGPEPGAPVPAG